MPSESIMSFKKLKLYEVPNFEFMINDTIGIIDH